MKVTIPGQAVAIAQVPIARLFMCEIDGHQYCCMKAVEIGAADDDPEPVAVIIAPQSTGNDRLYDTIRLRDFGQDAVILLDDRVSIKVDHEPAVYSN
ncbi:hypothetical protein, partial [Azospirillum palustre]